MKSTKSGKTNMNEYSNWSAGTLAASYAKGALGVSGPENCGYGAGAGGKAHAVPSGAEGRGGGSCCDIGDTSHCDDAGRRNGKGGAEYINGGGSSEGAGSVAKRSGSGGRSIDGGRGGDSDGDGDGDGSDAGHIEGEGEGGRCGRGGGDWALANGAAATFSPVMSISTCTCVGSVPSPTIPMSRFMDATASFTGISSEMPKKARSAATLSAKEGLAIQKFLIWARSVEVSCEMRNRGSELLEE